MKFNTETKTFGSIRKVKAYGACGVILALAALALITGQRGYADEVAADTVPATTITTSNPATNLPEAQAEPSPEQTNTANQAGTQSGELTVLVTSSELNGAVDTANETGVVVDAGATPVVHESLESAQADLVNQKQAVETVTKQQEANNAEVKEAVERNKEIDAQNKAEKERVDQANKQGQEAVDQRNKLGQEAVDARNKENKAKIDAQNKEIDKRNQEKQDNAKAIEAENEAIKKRNAEGQAKVDAENAEIKKHNAEVEKRNKAEEERYKRELAEAEAKKKENGYTNQIIEKHLIFESDWSKDAKMSVQANTYISEEEAKKALNYNGDNHAFLRSRDLANYTTTNPSRFVRAKVGEDVVVTYTDLNARYDNKKITKAVFTYQVKSTSSNDGIINLMIHDNPATTIDIGAPNDNGADSDIFTKIELFYEDGTKVTPAADKPFAYSIASLNSDGKVHKEYVSLGAGSKFIPINGSYVSEHADGIYSSQDIDYGDGTGVVTSDWDSKDNSNAYYGAGIVTTTGDIEFHFGVKVGGDTNANNSEWFAFNTSFKAPTVNPVLVEKEKELKTFTPEPLKDPVTVELEVPVTFTPEMFTPEVYKPITPVVIPHVEVPESKTYTVAVHPVIVKQAPKNTKSVVNEDNVNVNGQLVPKGHIATWVLANDNLKAGRKEISEYKLTDPFPAGFEIKLADLAKANQEHWLVAEDEKGQTIILANQQLLNQMNANRNLDFVVPVFYASGRPLNDGGTYENTFDTTITTKDNEVFRTVSNTPVIYTPGAENRTYNGSVIVRYQDTEGNTIRGNVIDVEDGEVGSDYDTTDNKPSIIAFEGKQYRLTPEVIGEETGQVVKGTKYVTYIYELVPNQESQGSVIVHYVDEETGRPISNDVVDTPESPVGIDYNTTDHKPKVIKTNDGVEYHLVPEKTQGSEEGKVVEGTTEVTYVYKRITPKPETPTPDDHVIQPKKDVVDEVGNSINGTTVLPNQRIHYKVTRSNSQYKGMKASQEAIAKLFMDIDDYKDEALDGKSLVVHSITASNGDDVSQLLDMYHVLSRDTLEEKLQKIVKEGHISPVGEFYLWVAKDPDAFFRAYIQKGLDITYNLSFKIKETFTEGEITNENYQLDFGNGYKGTLVTNYLPTIAVHKEVLNKEGQSINGEEVKLGDKVTYKLEGWVIPTGRGYDIKEYRFVDLLQKSHDEYRDFKVEAKADFKLVDGTLITEGTNLLKFTEHSYNAETGRFELRFKEDFLAQIPRSSEFGADAYIVVKRIKDGKVENEYDLFINDNGVISDKVVTYTRTPKPIPAQPEAPTPVVEKAPEATPVLPKTGTKATTGLVALGLLLLSALGLAGLAHKKEK